MKITDEYLDQLLQEKLGLVIEKLVEVDKALYAKENQDLWRLVRDSFLILQDLKNGIRLNYGDEE